MQHLVDAIRNADLNKYAEPSLNNSIVFAVRGTDKPVNVGDVLAVSYEWADGEQTNNQLSGTCACKIIDGFDLDSYEDDELRELIKKALKQAANYGDNLALVYGIDMQAVVNDDFANEIVIDDCTVIAVAEV